jgi:hypothetical protein
MGLGRHFISAGPLPLFTSLITTGLKIEVRDLDSDGAITLHQNVGLVRVADDATRQLVGLAEALEIVVLHIGVCFPRRGRAHGASLEIALRLNEYW